MSLDKCEVHNASKYQYYIIHCNYGSALHNSRQLRDIIHRNCLVPHIRKLSVPPELRHQLNAACGQKCQAHSGMNKRIPNNMKIAKKMSSRMCATGSHKPLSCAGSYAHDTQVNEVHPPQNIQAIINVDDNPAQVNKRGPDKAVTLASIVDDLQKSDVSASASGLGRGRRKRATVLKEVDGRPRSAKKIKRKQKRQKETHIELNNTTIHDAPSKCSPGSAHLSVEDSVGNFSDMSTSSTDVDSTWCQPAASALQASYSFSAVRRKKTDISLSSPCFSVTSHDTTFSSAKDRGYLHKEDTILQTESDSEEIDCTFLEVEYPAPSTCQQKEARRLARAKQLEQMRSREAALNRRERLLRRQGTLRKPDKHREKRVSWKDEKNLVRVFVYTQVTEEVTEHDDQSPVI